MATITPYETRAGRRYRVRYRKPDGKQTDKRGFTTKRDAQMFLNSVEVDKSQGTYIDPTAGRTRVRDLWPIYEAGAQGLKPTTLYSKEIAWRIRVQPAFGEREVSSIRPSEVMTWVSGMIGEGSSRETIAAATTVLRGIFDIAVADRLVPSSPMGAVRLPKKRRKRKVYLTHQDVKRLAEASKYPEFVYTLAYCGLRWGEAAGLKVGDVDVKRRRLHLRDNVTEVGGKAWQEGTLKNHEARSVAIPPFLMTMYRPMLLRPDGERMFVTETGNVMLNSRSTKSWKSQNKSEGWFTRAKKAAGLEVTPHDLRHTAASLAVSSGANVKVVQRMLGHKSAAMTLDTYAELWDDDLDTVASSLDRARSEAI